MDKFTINHYEACFKIGKKYSKKIKDRVEEGYKKTVGFNRKKIEFLKESFPYYWEELRGIADGSGISFDKVLSMNTYDVNFKGCSSVVFFDKGIPLIAHNEDCSEKKPSNEIAKFLEFKYPDSKFTSLVYFGELAGNAVSFNKYGLALFMNFIDGIKRKNIKNYVPEYFLFRKILDCKTIEEALKIFKKYPTPTGYHCTVSQNGKVFSVEKLYDKTKVLKITKNYVHTNFFISKGFAGKDNPSANPVERLKSINRMVKEEYPLKKIMLDKTGTPNAVCGGYKDSTKTLVSTIFNAKTNKIIFHKEYK